MSNVAHYSAILKEIYAPAISKEFKRNKPLLEKLEASSEHVDMSGRHYYVPLALQSNQAVGTAAEHDTIGAPLRTTTAAAIYGSFIQYGVCQMSERALKASTGAETAWENLREFEFSSIIETLRQNVNRQLYADGTGNLANCAAATAVNTIPVTTGAPLSPAGTTNLTRYIFVNMRVDIIDRTNGNVLAANRGVTAVTANNFTIDGAAVTTTANHSVYRAGSYLKEWNGLHNIVAATGAVGGVNPTTAGHQNWAAYRDAVGGTLGFPLVQQAFDAIELVGGKVNLIIASYGVYRAMANYMESMKRIVVDGTVKLAGGMSGMTWNGVECYKDQDCPRGTAYFIDYDGLQIGQIGEPGWLDTGGPDGGVLQYIPRSFTYEATYYWDGNLLCVHRNRLGAIQNITES